MLQQQGALSPRTGRHAGRSTHYSHTTLTAYTVYSNQNNTTITSTQEHLQAMDEQKRFLEVVIQSAENENNGFV